MACLKDASYATVGCRHLSKRYLECRMSKCGAPRARPRSAGADAAPLARRGLMAEEDLSKLGFTAGEAAPKQQQQAAAKAAAADARAAEKAGFVAGLRPLAVAEANAQARKAS